jgi:hypothetical protein
VGHISLLKHTIFIFYERNLVSFFLEKFIPLSKSPQNHSDPSMLSALSHSDYDIQPLVIPNPDRYTPLDMLVRPCPCTICIKFNSDVANTPYFWNKRIKIKEVPDFETILVSLPVESRKKITHLSVYSSETVSDGTGICDILQLLPNLLKIKLFNCSNLSRISPFY